MFVVLLFSDQVGDKQQATLCVTAWNGSCFFLRECGISHVSFVHPSARGSDRKPYLLLQSFSINITQENIQ